MKKIIAIVLLTILMVGCSNTKKNNNINESLNNLKENDEFVFSNMENLNDATLLPEMGISTNYVENYIVSKTSDEVNDLYIIIKPKKKYKNEVQSLIELYILTSASKKRMQEFDSNTMECIDECKGSKKISNYLFKEYKGYLIYIVSNNNELVFKTIKNNL